MKEEFSSAINIKSKCDYDIVDFDKVSSGDSEFIKNTSSSYWFIDSGYTKFILPYKL